MKTAWVFLGFILGPTAPRDQYPPRLRNILESKPATTSEVEWTASWIGGRDDGLVERYVTRKAGDALWESNLGDENGFHPVGFSADEDASSEKELPQHGVPKEESPIAHEEWHRKHEIPKEKLAGTRNSLIYDDQAWYLSRAERPLSGKLQPAVTARVWLPLDLSSIGLAPCWVSDFDANPFHLHQSSFEGFDSATFHEARENGLPTLSAEWGGSSRLTWRFDDRRGGKPVWAGFELDNELVFYSETEYERIGERWFAKSVRFHRGDSASPYKMIDVQRATFDEPWHMQEITPTDIGALYGTQFGGPDGMKMWTGAELIPDDEFWDLVYLDGILPDPRIVQLLAEPQQTADEYVEFLRGKGAQWRETYRKKYGEEPWLVKKSPKEKDEWDVYVDKFLAEHKLPEPGVKRANEIRDQSKKLRDAYRRKNAAALRMAKEENESRKVAEYEGIEKRIFDRVLVRDLKRLLPDEKGAPKKAP